MITKYVTIPHITIDKSRICLLSSFVRKNKGCVIYQLFENSMEEMSQKTTLKKMKPFNN